MITHGKTSDWDLKLADGEAAQGRLERILLAKGDTVEVKTEPKFEQTENIAVEFSQRNPRGGIKPSGIAASKAFWWAIEFVEGRWLILPTEELRQLGRLEYGRRRRLQPSFAGTPMGDNGNIGVLLPLATLIDPFLITPEDRRGESGLRSVAA